MEINYCLFTLLRGNRTKAVQYCCIAKETQQCCTRALLRYYGNHNTQQYLKPAMTLGNFCPTVNNSGFHGNVTVFM
jgi:hypothetical protein